MTGSTLGHYRILERLGRGGMGEVYRAEDTRLKRQVALKVIPPDVVADESRLKRFQREAEALAALDHPGVVAVHSVEEEDGTHFLTMALVQGRTLTEEIAAGAASLDRFFRLAIRLADALAASHDRGVVHRDLKPANIMVDDEGRPRILDFGLASLSRHAGVAPMSEVETRLTQEREVTGTLPYMSPEQLRGEEADHRSDVFSLGVVLYELATGTYPFQGRTATALGSSILTEMPPPAHEVRPELPRQLGRIIQGCLEKDPARRCQDARDLRNQLQALRKELEAEAILSGESGLGTARVERRARAAAPAWTGVAAVLVLIVALVAPFLYRASVGSEDAGGDAARIDSLVVLPFDNLMNDPEQEYFVQGMHESLITDLSRIGALRVVSRTSAMAYRDSGKSIPEIAEELDVDAVIEGSVLRAGDRVRITAQLIDARDDRHLWADSYDRQLEDVLGILGEVARAVSREIEIQLSPELQARFANRGPVDPAVQEALLRGRYLFNQFVGLDKFRLALQHFEEAVRLAPDYGPGWAWKANAHIILGQGAKVHESPARQAAERALELDPEQSQAHSALGWVELWYDWDWEGASASFRRALQLDPNNPYALHGYSNYLAAMGRLEESRDYSRRAFRALPVSPLSYLVLVGGDLRARDYGAAERAAREGLELFPGHLGLMGYLEGALWGLGRHSEAVALRVRSLPPEDAAAFQRAYDRGGVEAAEEWDAELYVGLAEAEEAWAFDAARALAAAGRADAALTWLERAFEARRLKVYELAAPAFDSLRSEPRFVDLLERSGLPIEPPDVARATTLSPDPAAP